MVIAPAKTGSESNSRKAVIRIDHTKRGSWFIVRPKVLIFKIVTMKLIAPIIEDAPARCKLKIPKSTAGPECASIPLRGGYTVHPVPTPVSIKEDKRSRAREGGRSQKERLFRRGNAISGAPIKTGTSQFPNPPTITGITIKNHNKGMCCNKHIIKLVIAQQIVVRRWRQFKSDK